MRSRRQMLIAVVLLLGLTLPCLAQEPANTPKPTEQQQQQPQHQDAPAPEPHPDLKPLLDAIRAQLSERKYGEALQQADTLLQQATEKGDKVGQAYAHRLRAWALQRLRKGQDAQLAWEQAEQFWREVGEEAFVVEALLGRAFCLWRTNETLAKELVAQALERARVEQKRPLAAARVLNDVGVDWYDARVLGVAQRCWEQALAIFESLIPSSLDVAATLNNLGNVARNRGDLELAQRYYEQALAIKERLAPNSLTVATTLASLGNVALERGDLALAQRYYEQALALYERLAPNSLDVAATLSNLGAVALERGDLALAQRYYEQALALFERLAPDSLQVAAALNNLGLVALERGDLALAQRYLEQALALYERLAPNSLDVATALNNLGLVALERGDLALAQRYYEQALALYERLAPNSLDVAVTLNNLGNVALERGDLALAQRYLEQALAIKERLAPNSLTVATTLVSLGNVALERGDLALAQRYYEQALALFERLAPNSLDVAATLSNLGAVALERGDLALAQRYYEQALALFERLAPNSLTVATTLNNLARLKLIQRQPHVALQLLQRATAIVETQRQALPDPETRALLAEWQFQPYLLLALAYLHLNQPAKAAETLERSRARSLAETLHQRQLAFSENLPAPLRQLLQQQQQLSAQRRQAYRQLQQADPNDREQVAQLQRTLGTIDQQQRALDERIRHEFPEFARQYLPAPLTIQQIQQSIDTGTVLLYHALVDDNLLIVAVSSTQVRGVVRKVNQGQLEQQVQELRRILSKMPAFRSAPERETWQRLSQQLYAQLIAPVQGMFKGAQRALLCPDGVLSQLPWAALIVKMQANQPVYWIEQVALHLTPSVGVYRQARQVQPAAQGVAVAAVWRYTSSEPIELAQAQSAVAALLRRSGASTLLTDLPAVRDEVQALRGLFGKQARVVVNAQATPQAARQ
ncbi:MAG: tetratricopeptide repeat protein [Fimbriimonadales bacterium]|nr:tetratricopeptide repeat protein [Fimbriimonadales bacterium]